MDATLFVSRDKYRVCGVSLFHPVNKTIALYQESGPAYVTFECDGKVMTVHKPKKIKAGHRFVFIHDQVNNPSDIGKSLVQRTT